MARRFLLVLTLAGGALVTAACRGEDTPVESASTDMAESLCAAAEAASEGRADPARQAFDEAHAALHDLAARAEEADRAIAADLLEAKQRVEASPAAHAGDYRALLAAAGRASEATGGGRIACGDG